MTFEGDSKKLPLKDFELVLLLFGSKPSLAKSILKQLWLYAEGEFRAEAGDIWPIQVNGSPVILLYNVMDTLSARPAGSANTDIDCKK